MITNRDQKESNQKDPKDEWIAHIKLWTIAPAGYQPDEDDPAWPSRSGQAD